MRLEKSKVTVSEIDVSTGMVVDGQSDPSYGVSFATIGLATISAPPGKAAEATTITAQWHYSWLAWWLLDMGGITVVLAAAARPSPIPAESAAQSPLSDRHAAQLRDRSTITGRVKREAAEARRRKNKSARAARSKTRRT
jgi:hypothetical protein